MRSLLGKTLRLLRKTNSRRVLALQKVQNLRLLLVRRGRDDEGIKVSGVPDVPGKSKIVTMLEWDLNPLSFSQKENSSMEDELRLSMIWRKKIAIKEIFPAKGFAWAPDRTEKRNGEKNETPLKQAAIANPSKAHSAPPSSLQFQCTSCFSPCRSGFAGALARREISLEKMKPTKDVYNRFARPKPIQPRYHA